jgi:molecular chaperone DnaK (HSP70)
LGYTLFPSPSYVLVGSAAKERIDTHPYHTLYHAKRVLGRLYDDDAVNELKHEVEFSISQKENDDNESENDVDSGNYYDSNVVFDVPFHSKNIKQGNNHNEMKKTNSNHHHISISPYQVGSYVVNHLMEITTQYLGHDNVRSAVIAVPAKFNADQRKDTVLAFQNIGVNVARILEEPVAAALAYGLQKKENVDFIIVYDFGGGTLDVSVLQVFEGGYVDVIGNDGDNRLGGADFDTAVAHFLLDGNDGFGSKVLNDISETLVELEKSHSTSSNNNSNDDDDDDDDNGIEERLVSECPKLADMPLCSISSFHTMGEKMKIDLSSFTDDDSVVSRECYGIPSNDTDYRPKEISDFCSMLEPIQFQMSLKQYDDVCAPLYDRSISPVSRILGDLDMTVDEIDEVVMVGGTTRMPQIRELVREALKVESLNTSIDPDLTVAYGAASVID